MAVSDRRLPIPRLIGLGLVVALAGTACGLHEPPASQSYGGHVPAPPKYIDGAGGARLGEAKDHPVKQARQQQQAQQTIQIVPSALPRPPAEMGFAWPVGSEGQLTSPFGWRVDPFARTRSFHHGLDVGCWMGQAIAASNDGRVLWAGRARVYGNAAVVSHGYGLLTVYAHLQSKLLVEPGARVRRGQALGTCGSSGRSTGPHLHFEVRHGNTVYDPLTFLP
jgi:murein DD-endopeptidase MepM/ murein hydrolase activator NlpD